MNGSIIRAVLRAGGVAALSKMLISLLFSAYYESSQKSIFFTLFSKDFP